MELQSPFDPQIDESEDEDVESDLRQAGAEVGFTAATPDVGSVGVRKAPVSRNESPQPLSYFEVRSLIEVEWEARASPIPLEWPTAPEVAAPDDESGALTDDDAVCANPNETNAPPARDPT
ncbi:MAG: hypothetical protein SGPRY_009155 [Prymnesium sp.]